MNIHNPQAFAMLFLKAEGVGLRLKNPNAAAGSRVQRRAGGCGRPGAPWGRGAAGERRQDSKPTPSFPAGAAEPLSLPTPTGASPAASGVPTQEL